MMKSSLRGRMIGLYLAFFLLVSIPLVTISWTQTIRQQDDLILNLATRQRVFIQAMTRDVLELEHDRDDEREHIIAVQTAADTFEQTLWALTNGGQAPDLSNQLVDVPATDDLNVLSRLHQVHHTWDIFRGYLNVLTAAEPESAEFVAAVRSVEHLAPTLLAESDAVVRQVELAATQHIFRLRWILSAVFASLVGLLALGHVITQKSLLKPLQRLGSIAERLGRGDLTTPIQVSGSREIEAIAHSLDAMRTQLQTSQAELQRQTEDLESHVVRRRHELKAAFEFSQDLVTDLELDRLLTSVTDQARTLTRAQASQLCLFTSNGKDIILGASSGQIITESGETPGRNFITQAVGVDGAIAKQLPCSNCNSFKSIGAERGLTTALRVGERNFGALCVVRSTTEEFDEDETRAFTLLANSAAIAVANAYLVESGRRQAEQLAALSERERLAADLHDNLAQTLSVLHLKADRLKETLAAGQIGVTETELDSLRANLNHAYSQLRATLVDLRRPLNGSEQNSPPKSESGPTLAEDLENLLAEFQEFARFSLELIITDPAMLAVSPLVQKQTLYIVREALTNIRRHALAKRVEVCVEPTAEKDQLRLTIEDDGRGFDLTNVNGDKHLGLTIMVARAERCGGQAVIDSVPGVGTKIVATLPLSRA